MGGTGPTTIHRVYCPANTWTTVLWVTGVFTFQKKPYVIRVGDNLVEYRRWSVGPLIFWPGSFRMIDTFNLWPWEGYIKVEIKPARAITVEVEPVSGTMITGSVPPVPPGP